MNSNFSNIMYGIMMSYADAYKKNGMENPPMHDPTTRAYVIQPDIFNVFIKFFREKVII